MGVVCAKKNKKAYARFFIIYLDAISKSLTSEKKLFTPTEIRRKKKIPGG
jgi:hypothetical protein